jgi:hypothetical protein
VLDGDATSAAISGFARFEDVADVARLNVDFVSDVSDDTVVALLSGAVGPDPDDDSNF